jgi:condensin complex subunit 2
MLHINKVNKSNAFQSRVADFVSKFISSSAEDNLEKEHLWQQYSSGIDSCAKVYGFCVDFVYSEAFKVLGGVNRSNADVVEDEEDEEERSADKKKRKVCAGLATLERNPEAITTNKFEFALTFDPYYKQLSSAFDSAGSRGLLLANLRINEAMELMLNSEDVLQPDSQMDLDAEISLRHLLPSGEGLQLCKEIEEYAGVTAPARAQEPPMPQLDFKWEEQSEESGDEMPLDFEAEQEENPVTSFKEVTLEDRLTSIVERDDYQYFSNPQLSSWAGFEHWNKRNMPAAAKLSEKRKRKEAVRVFLDFNVIEVTDKVLAKPGKSARNTWTAAYSRRVNVQELALPIDYEVSVQRLTQLFTRPQNFVKKTGDQRDVLVNSSQGTLPADTEAFFEASAEDKFDAAPSVALQFAKTSKRVDVRLLKDTIWRDLQSAAPGKENFRESQKPRTFMSVLSQLPSNLPQSELENLSMHSCFITMLHLANENSKAYADLTFEATSEVDFRIVPKLA